VALLMAEHRLSERHACRLLELDRSTYRYETRPDGNHELREALVALAQQKPRYGYRRLWAMLTRRGWAVNVKRIYRLYREEGLIVRRVKRKHIIRKRCADRQLTAPNQEWALDFVSDALASGRGLRGLTVVDSYTRECPAIAVATGIGSRQVTRTLVSLAHGREYGVPDNLAHDTGPLSHPAGAARRELPDARRILGGVATILLVSYTTRKANAERTRGKAGGFQNLPVKRKPGNKHAGARLSGRSTAADCRVFDASQRIRLSRHN
jgi:putative transposase